MSVPRPILCFEPDPKRLELLKPVVHQWGDGFELRHWNDSRTFRSEAAPFLKRAALLVLAEASELDTWLSDLEPVCQVVCASADKLRAGGWPTLDQPAKPAALSLGLERMRRSLTGLALGDALGEMLSHSARVAPERLAQADFPGTWYHTDDSEMALALCSILRAHGRVNQDALAARFVRRYQLDPDRGYGKMTRIQLRDLADGAHWQSLSRSAFGGQGSMGNGSAMRVAPLGAYFADDLERCVSEARAASEVTHAHPEAIAGCIAVAVAAALACRPIRLQLAEILPFVPSSQLRDRLEQAQDFTGSHLEAARLLGNGFQVTAQDTVPYSIWIATRTPHYVQAIGQAIEADGDCDTCAAITGGIVALSSPDTVPRHWKGHLDPELQN
jgi:ADP-ribosylglycohydrolase